MRIRFVAIAVLLSLILSCSSHDKKSPVEKSRFLLDTLVNISVYDQKCPVKKAENAIDRAFDLMQALEAKTSVHIDTSEVARIVQKAGQEAGEVSEETIQLLKQSVEISRQTEGLFDVTIGPVKDLWGFSGTSFRVPDSVEIRSVLSRVNYRDILFENGTVMLRFSGMEIDLGGIAKGYIIDRAVASLEEAGIRSGIVEAGGDLRIWGSHPYRELWKIGIKHPRGNGNDLIGVIQTKAISIATSGDYERYFMQDGKRYHHLLDPRTGYPATGCVSVTIVSEDAVFADAYATAVFIMGPEQGMKFIEQTGEIEGVIIFEQAGGLQYKISKGIQNQVQMF
jgi:thiamine biosynthesis lipoprotein